MPNDFLGLAELQTINDRNLSPDEASDIFNLAPVLRSMPAVVSSYGDQHKYLKYTGKPVPSFRAVNDGRDHDSTDDTAVTVSLKIMDASFTIDDAIAETFRSGKQALIQREATRHLSEALFQVERQMLNGTGLAAAAGFNGFPDDTGLDATADSHVIGAGGTSTTATLSQAYLVHWSTDNGVKIITGNDGAIMMDEPVLQRVDGATGHYGAWFVNALGWYGLQLGSVESTVRIVNIDDSANTMDDALLAQAIEVFPVGISPDVIVMDRRSHRQLQASRTATNPTGAPAPFPTESFGLPIIVTDALEKTSTVA